MKKGIAEKHATAVDIILEAANADVSICNEDDLRDRIMEFHAYQVLINRVRFTETVEELAKMLIAAGWDKEFVDTVLAEPRH